MQYNDTKTLQLSRNLGYLIKQIRKNKTHMSLDGLANAYDINKGTLSLIENGIYNCKFVTLWKLSEALGIKCSDLVRELEKELGEDFTLLDE